MSNKRKRYNPEFKAKVALAALKNEETIGKFCVREKAERKGRKPSTGEAMMLDAKKVVTFKPSGKLRDKVNG